VKRVIVSSVVAQHVEDLGILWNTRRGLVVSGSAALRHVARLDERLAAHQDGCVVAGAGGFELLMEQMVDPTPSTMFAATLNALDVRDKTRFESCLAVGETIPESVAGITSALGWVERDRLVGFGQDLLVAQVPFLRRMGLSACRVHVVDPGAPVLAALKSENASVRAEGLRATGTLGRHELVSTIAAVRDQDPTCRMWAAWSAVLLGNRSAALESLAEIGLAPGPHRARAFRLAVQAMKTTATRAILKEVAQDPQQLRWLIQASGITGDSTYVPWLIGLMSNDQTARIGGEAFSLITGTDLALLDLERKPPENVESGPNDDPEDPNVEMDPDDGLPWPDQERIQTWWVANNSRFQAGTRYFMGAPVTREHCIEVLKDGYQRQRILAAHYLCLLNPGTPLFNTSAPAWRQQKLLAQME